MENQLSYDAFGLLLDRYKDYSSRESEMARNFKFDYTERLVVNIFGDILCMLSLSQRYRAKHVVKLLSYSSSRSVVLGETALRHKYFPSNYVCLYVEAIFRSAGKFTRATDLNKFTIKELITFVLCHEMVHFKQMLQNRLYFDSGTIVWQANKYDEKRYLISDIMENYQELPWEKEANAIGEEMLDRIKLLHSWNNIPEWRE